MSQRKTASYCSDLSYLARADNGEFVRQAYPSEVDTGRLSHEDVFTIKEGGKRIRVRAQRGGKVWGPWGLV
jgi:hypothetical protein